ncbi:transposase, IS4 family domain protein, partial [Mycobacterium xenopi 4042]
MHYPAAVEDPTPGVDLRCQVAETPYTLRLARGRTLTVRLVVRGSKTPATWMRCFRVALSPVCHQLRAAGRPGRYHPPTPRHHRNHLRR